MSTTPPPERRFIVALTAAVASATLAIGVTTAALLGWIGPRTTAGEPGGPAPEGAGSSQVIYVPITPTAPSIEPSTVSEPRFAMVDTSSYRDDRGDRRDHDDHGDRDDHDEDDDD